jgi:hypothetical protein
VHSVFRRPLRSPRFLASMVLVAAGLVLAGCSEVASNQVKSQPYSLEPTGNPDIQRVKLADPIAARIDLQTAEVSRTGTETAVPHEAIIYNPLGEVFVYTKPAPGTYVRAPIVVDHVVGDQVVLTEGPPAGTVVVTTGAAELLATEYEILNQHP